MQRTCLSDGAEIYVWREPDNGVQAVIREEDGAATRPLPRCGGHTATRSEDFEWNYGYGGSGPADLALSILTACVDRATAEQMYQAFKWEYCAGQRHRQWTISVRTIRKWIQRQWEGVGGED